MFFNNSDTSSSGYVARAVVRFEYYSALESISKLKTTEKWFREILISNALYNFMLRKLGSLCQGGRTTDLSRRYYL